MTCKKTLVDGQWTADQARWRGEMLHATVSRAEIPAYLLVSVTGYDDRLRPITITVAVRAGYGSQEHLFDRTIQRIAASVEGRIFTSAPAARQAANVPHRESLAYSVEIEEERCLIDVPPDLAEAAKSLTKARWRKERIAGLRGLAQWLRGLVVRQTRGGYWVLTRDDFLGEQYQWGDGRWCIYALEPTDGLPLQMYSSVFAGEPSADAAKKSRAIYLERITEAIRAEERGA